MQGGAAASSAQIPLAIGGAPMPMPTPAAAQTIMQNPIIPQDQFAQAMQFCRQYGFGMVPQGQVVMAPPQQPMPQPGEPPEGEQGTANK